MKILSKSNQFFLFLMVITGQSAVASTLTKAEAENGRLINGNIGRIVAHLQRDPKGAGVLLKSAAVMVKELERLGKKDPESFFAKDAQKWRDVIGKFASLSRNPGKEQSIDTEKLTEEVNKFGELGHKIIMHQGKLTKDEMDQYEKKAVDIGKEVLELAARGGYAELDRVSDEIKEKYKQAITTHMRLQQSFNQIDMAQLADSFNSKIDEIVRNITKQQRELKQAQQGGLSYEDIRVEFDEFIVDKIKQARADTITVEQKNSSDKELFEVVRRMLFSLKGYSSKEIANVVNYIKNKYGTVIDQQYNPGLLYTFIGYNLDTDRKNLINKRLDEMFVQLSAGNDENAVEQKEAVVEQVVENEEEQLRQIPLTPPKRPQSGENLPIQRPSQPKVEAQQYEPVQLAQEKQQEKVVEKTFETLMQHMLKEDTALYDDTKKDYENIAVERAKVELLTLSGEERIKRVDELKDRYNQVIKDQDNRIIHHGYWEDDISVRQESFSKRLDEVVKEIAEQEEA